LSWNYHFYIKLLHGQARARTRGWMMVNLQVEARAALTAALLGRQHGNEIVNIIN